MAEFLNNIIQDTSLQNEKEVLSFLQLPLSFKFTKEMLTNNRADLESVEKNWYDVYRKLKLDIVNESATTINERIQLHNRINRLYQPRMIELLQTVSNVDHNEAIKRKQLIGQLQEKVDELLKNDQPRELKSKRVLGSGSTSVKETAETLPLDNRELLQHQIQIHKDQDKELEQLRVMIARQRQIGELINTEVEEQNAMLIGLMRKLTTLLGESNKRVVEQERFYNSLFTASILSAILFTRTGAPSCSLESCSSS